MCPNCGADLEVPEGVTVLKCRYCSSALRLKENNSVRALALIDAKLDDVVAHTSRAADGVAEVSYQLQAQARDQRVRERARIANWEAGRAKLEREQRSANNGCTVVLLMALLTVGTVLFLPSLAAGLTDEETWGKAVIGIMVGGVALLLILMLVASHFSQENKAIKEKLAAWDLRRPH